MTSVHATGLPAQEILFDTDRLFDMYEKMLGEATMVDTLSHATEVARQLFNAEGATVYFILPDTEELVSVVTTSHVRRVIRVPIDPSSLAGYCAQSRRSFVVADAYGDLSHIDRGLRFDPRWDELNQFRTHNVMCAPVIFREELLGVTQILNCEEAVLNDEHLPVLKNLCRFVGYALYYARLCDDISSLKKLEKEKAEFIQIMTHELRSPVSVSKSMAATLRYLNQDNPELGKVLGRIEQRMDHLLALVSDLLSLSRIKAGKPLGEIASVDLAGAAASLIENARTEAETRHLEFVYSPPPMPVCARLDIQAYELIVSNLLSNALKYTEAGQVRISIASTGDQSVVRVADTGMGIPEADIPKLFKEFFRARNAKCSQIPGSGVGLAGIKDLIERFGGHIELQSQEGRGTEFSVFFPRIQAGEL